MNRMDLHNSYLEKIISSRNKKIDNLIIEALSFVYGKDFNIEQLKGRGQVNYYSYGSFHFVMDGRILLEFHKLEHSEIFFRNYKKIENEFNKCLDDNDIIKSETL